MLTREIQAALISIIFHGTGVYFMFLFLNGEKEELVKTQFNVQLLPIEAPIENSLFLEGIKEKKQLSEPENSDFMPLADTIYPQPKANTSQVPTKEVHSSQINSNSQLADKLLNVQEQENIQTSILEITGELAMVQSKTENIAISTSSKVWLKPKVSSVMSSVRSVVAEQLSEKNSPKLEEYFEGESIKKHSTQTGVVSRKFKWDKLERSIIRGAKINYPELLAINAIETDLEVQLTISAEGSISNVILISSSGYSSVDAEVMQSFKLQQFTAGNQETIVSVSVEFRFLRSF